MAVAKRQRREKPRKREQRKVWTRVRTSGKTNSPPGWPNLHRAGSRGRGKKHKKRRQNSARGFSSVFWVGLPSRLEDVFFFACQ